jgi:hypothetical protein
MPPGAAPGAVNRFDPGQQAILATWVVKTALLLALGKFRGTSHGWVPRTTVRWLYDHRALRRPPPGTRVWMGGLKATDVPAFVQAATLHDAAQVPVAQCVTFSVACVLFQVSLAGRLRRGLPRARARADCGVGGFG